MVSLMTVYATHRIELPSWDSQAIKQGVEVVNPVEVGQFKLVLSATGLELRYAETAAIPAPTGSFKLVNCVGRAKLAKLT